MPGNVPARRAGKNPPEDLNAVISTASDGRSWGQFGGFQRDGEPFFFDVDGLPFVRDETGRTRFFGVSGSHSWTYDPAYGRRAGWEQRSRDELVAPRTFPLPPVPTPVPVSTAARTGSIVGLVLGVLCVIIGFVLGGVAQEYGAPFRVLGVVIGLVVFAVCAATGRSIDRGGPPTAIETIGAAYAAYKVDDLINQHRQHRQARYVADEQARRSGGDWTKPPR